MVKVNDVGFERSDLSADSCQEDVGKAELSFLPHSQQGGHSHHIGLLAWLVAIAGANDEDDVPQGFQAFAQACDGDGHAANERQVVVGEHGHPQGFRQPGLGVQIVVRIVVFRHENSGVKLGADQYEHCHQQDEVYIAHIKQRVDKEPQGFQGTQYRVLSRLQAHHRMADFAVVVHIDAHIVVETGVVVQHQPARSAGGDKACITLDLIRIQRQVR